MTFSFQINRQLWDYSMFPQEEKTNTNTRYPMQNGLFIKVLLYCLVQSEKIKFFTPVFFGRQNNSFHPAEVGVPPAFLTDPSRLSLHLKHRLVILWLCVCPVFQSFVPCPQGSGLCGLLQSHTLQLYFIMGFITRARL